ncbi:GRF zinc finger domain-containing protein [Nannizzia gypsea CBS 118893]|uniref:GRF zinc finger domain-containing protein n=1 Tax=Arthroderma gypseum (strain ATCC MYA-4604 / CBS 118893) TaxID=535722 RepID=E5R1J5_ARTGP|nr:GRF zinc finger domain-containing protein [Nannizzia gypsea CBS 118893]EFQ98531.1 GRF zinc finger domain-containing protein [Nannizzia gypsea CBS 118893]
MDKFIIRKRQRTPPTATAISSRDTHNAGSLDTVNLIHEEDDSTDIKLAKLASIFPDIPPGELLDLLIANEGSIEATTSSLVEHSIARKKAKQLTSNSGSIQSSLSSYKILLDSDRDIGSPGLLPTRKGKTLHLYSPEDISRYTSCTVIHNFLSPDEATALLKELLEESQTFHRQKFQIFDNVVSSPHSAGFYVMTEEELREQQSQYSYYGSLRNDVRKVTPELRRVSSIVKKAVNQEIEKRVRTFYPNGKKLKFQSPKEWEPNAAFVNCYDGPTESVGYHSDELTYLGPRAVIGSLSLGVAREFRVRRIVPPDDEDEDPDKNTSGEGGQNTDHNLVIDKLEKPKPDPSRSDIQGQISIHLPHNSLLVMHAETQEEWKHSIAPAQTISPHPVAGNKRINITYRWYRDSLHPKRTPRCRCNMPCVLRCVQRKKETRGKYMWMCYSSYAPGKQSCSFFQWATFDDDGEPIWDENRTKVH